MEKDGDVTGGPVYYIKAAFSGTPGKVLAGLFAVFIILALGFMGNMVQSNSIGAFNPQAVTGAALGITIRQAIRFGVARGLFSNEAGIGSTPHAHARAKAKCPDDQGLR